MSQEEKSVSRVLVLAAPMGAIGGVQNYATNLFSAMKEILGAENVRLLAVPTEPKRRLGGGESLGWLTKLRFLAASLFVAGLWRPRLMICTHIGVAPAASIVQKLTGIPYWLVLHGIEVWGELPLGKLRALQSADRVLAVSRFTLDIAASRHSLRSANAVILPPAFEINGNGTADGASRTALGDLVDPARPTVLTVGRLASGERYKGHDVMLEAWPLVLRQIPNALYLIVGDGDDRARLEARAAEIGIAHSVHFAGSVRGDALSACYEACQVFAMPAQTELDPQSPRGEGFGIVFLEAMAHGKPVVGPSVGAPAEFIRHGENGLLVDPNGRAEIAQALIDLLREPERSRVMGQAGRALVNSQFSYGEFRRRLRDALVESGVAAKPRLSARSPD